MTKPYQIPVSFFPQPPRVEEQPSFNVVPSNNQQSGRKVLQANILFDNCIYELIEEDIDTLIREGQQRELQKNQNQDAARLAKYNFPTFNGLGQYQAITRQVGTRNK